MLTPRPAGQDDLPFILDSFTNEYSRSVYADGLARTQVRQLMVTILSRPDWNCTVLCESDVADEILAYTVWRDPHHVAWLHVKGRYRHQGIARRLLAAIEAVPGAIKATFIPSPAFARSVRSHGWNLLHRPWQGIA
jgi:GNAT superfamily N-acetyltransferase